MEQRTGSGSGRKCARLCAVLSFVRNDLPHLQINDAHCRCFCVDCNESRGDLPTGVHRRGRFPYVLPAGFAKVALRLSKVQVDNLRTWAPAFHGTTVESAKKILSAENGHYLLLNPGDKLSDGTPLGVRKGHITIDFNRTNAHAKQREHFDATDKVFMSPSIRYATHPAYSPLPGEKVKFQVADSADPRHDVPVAARVKVALDIRLDPGPPDEGPGFGIGQETVGAKSSRIDPVLPNECLEYYTNRRQVHFIAALMVRIVSVEGQKFQNLVMEVPNVSVYRSPQTVLLPPIGYIEEPREQEPGLFKLARGGGAVAGQNVATTTTTKVVEKTVVKWVPQKAVEEALELSTTSTSSAQTLLTRGGTEMRPVKQTVAQKVTGTTITGASSIAGGAAVGLMSLPIGLVCDGVRCAVGKGPPDMGKQFNTRLKNTPKQMVATAAGAAIGTAIFPGVGTQVGMFCGSVVSALVFEEATE